MKLHEMVPLIRSRDELVTFIGELVEDLKTRPEDWQNVTLERFLSALARWLEDSDGYYINHGIPVPKDPTWKTVADMLIAAKMYE